MDLEAIAYIAAGGLILYLIGAILYKIAYTAAWDALKDFNKLSESDKNKSENLT